MLSGSEPYPRWVPLIHVEINTSSESRHSVDQRFSSMNTQITFLTIVP